MAENQDQEVAITLEEVYDAIRRVFTVGPGEDKWKGDYVQGFKSLHKDSPTHILKDVLA